MQASATPGAQGTVPHMKVQKAGRFAFINLSEPNQSKDESLRKFVRSNAMCDFRQKQKQTAVTRRSRQASSKHEGSGCGRLSPTAKSHGDRPTGCADSIAVEEDQNSVKTMAQPLGEDGSPCRTCNHMRCNKNRCNLLQSLQETTIINPKKLIGDGMSDPFNGYPTSGCPRYYSYLLNHCENIHLQALSLSLHFPPLHFLTHPSLH